MLDRPIPARGDVYRHFKGTNYLVIGVTQAEGGEKRVFSTLDELMQDFPFLKFTNANTGDPISVGIIDDSYYAYNSDGFIADRLVLYREHDPKDAAIAQLRAQLWARPLDNFLDLLCNGKRVDPAQDTHGKTLYCRFEKLPDASM
ncbi:MAG: hypothetical protein AAGA75_17485 [Cyanobacteria bacterium P01_E01_bin.6]